MYKHTGEWQIKDNAISFKKITRTFSTKLAAIAWCTACILKDDHARTRIETYAQAYDAAQTDVISFKAWLMKPDINEFDYDLYCARHDAAIRHAHNSRSQLLRIAKSLKIR